MNFQNDPLLLKLVVKNIIRFCDLSNTCASDSSEMVDQSVNLIAKNEFIFLGTVLLKVEDQNLREFRITSYAVFNWV